MSSACPMISYARNQEDVLPARAFAVLEETCNPRTVFHVNEMHPLQKEGSALSEARANQEAATFCGHRDVLRETGGHPLWFGPRPVRRSPRLRLAARRSA